MTTYDLTYFLPCKPGSVYINVTDECMNNCLFCIKRDFYDFYGCNLRLNGRYPEANEIIASLVTINGWERIKEIVFCGMGEPLLRYNCVLDASHKIREIKGTNAKIRIDTSGLFWAYHKRLDFLDSCDILSISLNAENAEKYEELCRPKISRAYSILMDFLQSIKNVETNYIHEGRCFPEIRLSVVDTSEEEYIPKSGRTEYMLGAFPVPDFGMCERIATNFGWPLIVKRLFRDSKDARWKDKSFMELCARGISLDTCINCSHKH